MLTRTAFVANIALILKIVCYIFSKYTFFDFELSINTRSTNLEWQITETRVKQNSKNSILLKELVDTGRYIHILSTEVI